MPPRRARSLSLPLPSPSLRHARLTCFSLLSSIATGSASSVSQASRALYSLLFFAADPNSMVVYGAGMGGMGGGMGGPGMAAPGMMPQQGYGMPPQGYGY
eukprot:4603494-Pleurochrysis_carterae.AAC.3